ncbi:DUF2079 domain-containing protein [Actinomyces faecalis]|uniref:DUF2079 domain-containing protein n=1 Tax=Actinomyces faecalis TaxID=2722820 RepID=UPI001C12D6AF|nr:DUF2079 domain-containing protein [Actinomyces faecalis]
MFTRAARLPECVRVLPAAAVTVVGAAVFIALSVGQWRSYQVPSWDLAIFSQLAKDYASLQAPIVPIKGEGFNLLGDHFHPVLVLLAPAWRLAPSPLTLLIVQDLLLALSAWPLTRLATRYLGAVGGTVLGLSYVLSWGLQTAVAAQFHEIAFAVPLLAWASAAFAEGRWWAVAGWSAPLVLVKEDLGLTVLMIGLAVVWRGRHDGPAGAPDRARLRLGRRVLEPTTTQLGLGLAAFGVVAFLVTVGLVLPALSPSGGWEYGLSGNTSDGGGFSGPTAANPLVRALWPPVKLVTLLLLALTAGGIGLASPWAAVMLPTLAWRFLSTKSTYWEWSQWHYNAVLMPIALGALLEVLIRLQQHAQSPDDVARLRPETRPRGPASDLSLWRPSTPAWLQGLALVAVVISTATTLWAAPGLPLAQMTDPGWGQESARAASAREVLDLIPSGATVESDLGLLPYLVPEHTVYWVGTAQGVVPDYVVIDPLSDSWGATAPQDAAAWAEEQTGARYELVFDRDSYQVAKHVG